MISRAGERRTFCIPSSRPSRPALRQSGASATRGGLNSSSMVDDGGSLKNHMDEVLRSIIKQLRNTAIIETWKDVDSRGLALVVIGIVVALENAADPAGRCRRYRDQREEQRVLFPA